MTNLGIESPIKSEGFGKSKMSSVSAKYCLMLAYISK